MNLKFFKNYWLVLLVTLSSCEPEPIIPISSTLQIGLNDRYNNYVRLLNKAGSGDTAALSHFLAVKDIYDGAGYDHGWVLIELMKMLGDKKFAEALNKISEKQKDDIKSYFKVGFDVHTEASKLYERYPTTFKSLSLMKKDKF